MKIDEAKLKAATERLRYDLLGAYVGLDFQRRLTEWVKTTIESVVNDAPGEEAIDLGLPWKVSSVNKAFVRDKEDRTIIECCYRKHCEARAAHIMRACNGYQKAIDVLHAIRIDYTAAKPADKARRVLKDLGELKDDAE